jgi:hypothetical protein
MTFRHGKNAKAILGALDLSPYLTSIESSFDVETADTTTFGATWKSSIPGEISSKVDFSGYYDPAVGLVGMAVGLTADILTVGPAGVSAIGDPVRLFSIYEVSISESVPVGGIVAVKGSFMANGKVGIGYVLQPIVENTSVITGADRDDAAPTSTGWTSHLHIVAITGGSWVVTLQDAATNDWADLSGGGFTAATSGANLSQRLVSATATATVRRHVRYYAKRTGGSGGDTLTFQLMFARN